MAKRYQQIIDKDLKLRNQFPVYYDGQVIPLTTPVKVTLNTLSSLKEGGKQKGASTCKSSQIYAETGSISVNELRSSNIITEKTENDHLPKIVEVYSLNSLKSNAQEPGLKTNTPGGLSSKNEETFVKKLDVSIKQPSKSLLQDANACTHSSQMKPYLVSDNFIDLTIDDDEETKSCNDSDVAIPGGKGLCGRDVYADDQSEFDPPKEDTGDKERQNQSEVDPPREDTGDKERQNQSEVDPPREDTGDKEQQNQSEVDPPREATGDNERQNKKSSQYKRKGVFGSRRKVKKKCQAQNQKQQYTTKSLNADLDCSGCNSDSLIQVDQDKTQCKILIDQQYSNQGNGEQKLNDLKPNGNDCRKEEKNSTEKTEGGKEHWNGDGINGGLYISSDMTYRENKITTLKAKLAKQEEELARLRTQKESNMAKVRSLEAPDQDVGQEKIKSEAKDWSNKVHETQEVTKDDPLEVNLDDICQHVLKSFDIYNARQWEIKTRKTEGFYTLHEENTGVIKQANERKSDLNDVAYLPQGRQEEFLFQIGLRRRRPNNN